MKQYKFNIKKSTQESEKEYHCKHIMQDFSK